MRTKLQKSDQKRVEDGVYYSSFMLHPLRFYYSLNKDEIIVFLGAFWGDKSVIRDKLFRQIIEQTTLFYSV